MTLRTMIGMMRSLLILSLLYPAFGGAQEENSKKPRTTQLSFEDELIRGEIASPDLLYILKSKNVDYGKLLKLRDHFIPEMRQTKHDILRGSK